MGDSVKVKIFGQEYNISGDKPEDEILKIAQYVDNKMRLISKLTGQTGSVPTLTALNIAEEYFDSLSQIESLRIANKQTERDNAHYVKMLEESKKSYIQAKELAEKLQKEQSEEHGKYADLEKRCTEYENSVFDLQMENIQLKSELEKLNK
ncbi:cell division protein ZapA [Eubacterium pyruvativorans]|jgi:cell division protein ZapA (FtsZ GTPase activity inhibitor)|nr:cell division protein ZapA [Eubacterium pyruvativorans]MDD7684665.1 cell division protein ZapA [Eubacterium pyruvativorans]MDO5568292.1 cell division protein ZapA [Eubacteriales bacterium]MDY4050116.1 cell division protein ZapA [Eubacterium pyruvativorans]HAT82547.1 cell division protein ZapA [Eubacterium sp.]